MEAHELAATMKQYYETPRTAFTAAVSFSYTWVIELHGQDGSHVYWPTGGDEMVGRWLDQHS